MKTTLNARPDPASPAATLAAADALLDALPLGVLMLDEQRIVRRVNQQAACWCGAAPEALVGRPLAEAGLPPVVGAALGPLLEAGEAAPREVYLPEHEAWLSFSAARQPGGWVLYGQDITPQRQHEAEALRRQDELARGTTDQYHALFHSMDQGFCVLKLQFDDAGQHVVDFRYQQLNPVFSQQSGIPEGAQGKTAREVMPDLGSWDYDLLTREFFWSEGMYRLFGLPPGEAVEPRIYLDYVVEEDRPRAERLVHCLTTGSGDVEDVIRLQIGAQIKTVHFKSVVLSDAAGQPVRMLGVDLDISQLQRLEADNLRLRLTQQQALFEAVQAAQEAERKRMAESLHNGIGQMLYATKLRLDRLHAPLLGADAALAAARHEADQLLGEAIRQTRTLSHELVPLVLEEFGLATALRDIGGKMSTPQLRLRCQVLLDEDAAPLAPALQMALYRMAQELAQNVVKHARGATAASLELETMPGWALLRAEDNGAGFAGPPADSPGLGLRSIRDRVALLGGQLDTGAVPTGGAFVRIRIPLPSPITSAP